jgi:hypothetical protein
MKKLRCKNWEKYQHYKKRNKNFAVEQRWFMMYGRELITERKYMSLKPEVRDFLVTGCWCIGSQDNGFLPSPEDIAFKMRMDIETVEEYLSMMLKLDWLEEYDIDEYSQIMDEVHLQVEDNKRNNGIEKVREDEAMQKHVARLARRNTA